MSGGIATRALAGRARRLDPRWVVQSRLEYHEARGWRRMPFRAPRPTTRLKGPWSVKSQAARTRNAWLGPAMLTGAMFDQLVTPILWTSRVAAFDDWVTLYWDQPSAGAERPLPGARGGPKLGG